MPDEDDEPEPPGEVDEHPSEDVIAIHEGGHAAACFALGLTIEDARIFPYGDFYRGWVRPTYWDQFAHQGLRFFAAGYKAEQLAGEPAVDWPPHAGADKRAYDRVINAWQDAGHPAADIEAAELAASAALDHLIAAKAKAIGEVAAVLKAHPAKTPGGDHQRRVELVYDALRTYWGGAEPPIVQPPSQGSPIPGPLSM